MIKFSRNNQKYQNVRSPPEHSAIGNIHVHGDILYYFTTCHLKQLPVGLMVLSDGMVRFLKIEKNFIKSTKTILWL